MRPPLPYLAARRLPAAPPPMGGRGLRRWLTETLFGTPANTALTVLTLALLLWLGHALWQWGWTQAVWQAESAEACRQTVIALHGAGRRGACWPAVAAQAERLVYGAYPEALRWRISAAIGLLAVALVPLMARDMRPLVAIAAAVIGGKVALVIAALATGGPPTLDFGPTTAILATGGAAAFVFGRAENRRVWLLASAAFPLVLNALLWGWLPGLAAVPASMAGGGVLTLVLVVNAFAAALVLGMLLALGLWSELSLVRGPTAGFVAAMRMVPPVPLLLFALIGIPYLFPPGAVPGLLARATLVMAAITAAGVATALAEGLRAVPEGQALAARALGMRDGRILTSVILPQAIRRATPGLVRAAARLVRASTLVMVIGLTDILAMASPTVTPLRWQGAVLELYGVVAAGFLCISWALARYARRLDGADRHMGV